MTSIRDSFRSLLQGMGVGVQMNASSEAEQVIDEWEETTKEEQDDDTANKAVCAPTEQPEDTKPTDDTERGGNAGVPACGEDKEDADKQAATEDRLRCHAPTDRQEDTKPTDDTEKGGYAGVPACGEEKEDAEQQAATEDRLRCHAPTDKQEDTKPTDDTEKGGNAGVPACGEEKEDAEQQAATEDGHAPTEQQEDTAASTAAMAALQAQVAGLMAEKAELQKQLDSKPQDKKPIQTLTSMESKKFMSAKHSKDYLFGQEADMYARGHWYNEVTATGKEMTVGSAEAQELKVAFEKFATSTARRAEELAQNGSLAALNFRQMAAGEPLIDYSFPSEVEEFVVRRQDLVISYLRTLPGVEHIFPVHSHVQNKEAVATILLGSVSQADRIGAPAKGSISFGADVYQVDAALFRIRISNLQKLEKTYIGYLNTNGSEIIKWSFIEWLMIYFAEALIREQNERRVSGRKTTPQNVTDNAPLQAADGVLRAIQKAEDELRILPFEVGGYTSATMLETVEKMYDEFTKVVPDATNYKVYVNARHKQWYIRAYRAKYGQDADFTGSHATLADLSPDSIVWVPNMPLNSAKIWITEAGNIELLEDVPGEMLNFKFYDTADGVDVVSRWKEGAYIKKTGKRFATAEELVANNYADQFIFTNDATVEFDGDLRKATEYVVKEDVNLENVPSVAGQVIRLKADATVKVNGLKGLTDYELEEGKFIDLTQELTDETVMIDGESYKRTVPTGKYVIA